ncbi:hypothetical protein [Streptomyces althioticus]|uniref:hypothetical protein n=1 Tax=Streptomyces althioticus TaxID=83380 RepID=UPI0033EB48B1
MWQKDKTDANKLAAWTFDTAAKGQPYEATRFDGGAATGKAYTKKITAYGPLYNATNTQLLLPEGDPLRAAGVGPTLTSTAAYRIDNTVSQTGSPAVGGLPSEAVEYKYNATSQQITTRGSAYYLQKANSSPQGDLRDLWLSTGVKLIYVTNSYEEGTRRLTAIKVTDDVNSYPLQDLAFTQDDAGNVTSIFDTTTLGGAAKPAHQCFTYDGYSRVTEAWTPKTGDWAPAERTTANSAPYWTSYTYNDAGQRATETAHTRRPATKPPRTSTTTPPRTPSPTRSTRPPATAPPTTPTTAAETPPPAPAQPRSKPSPGPPKANCPR